MLWSFIAVFLSGWLYVDASYRGPVWQRWLFKPVTLLLMMLMVWQTPTLGLQGYLVILALAATLAGDALLLLPNQKIRFAVAAYFVSHLLYCVSFFVSQLSFGFFWPLPVALVVVTTLLLVLLGSRLKEERWSVTALVVMTALMVWVAGEHYFSLGSDANFALIAGAVLLFIGHAVWLIHHFRLPFRAHQALLAMCYFGGHFLIVRALYI
ncbi:lysoplasmalogenase [Musicola paradisiaca]|uniref:YhhN family protein n=1 Tax=Musicola paradisiaca (strain Ech703) TaxID=579405 RepID=C6C5J7_MUSP7|nr:lysoplasmalogenase [Musicola paradisiaca]ACS87634.1 YhhN family protein [Musicola paradisiaca Ech703]